jgi:hypothetical protein
MSAFALISGSLFRNPERKTSKAGKAYVTATVKAVAGNESEFWRKIELYRANDGSEKLSRTLMVDGVLALKPAPRERKPKPDAGGARTETGTQNGRDFDDPVPF